MIQTYDTSKRFMLLAGSRILGLLFSIVIPMYLGRHLAVESYGTYKQVMLLYWFAQTALNLGLDDSAVFFQRHDWKNFSLFGFNALVFNLAFTGVLALVMTLFRTELASALNNQDLARYLPLLGLLIVLTISSLQIEGFLINLGRMKARFALDAGTEFFKSALILGAYLFFDSLMAALSLLSALMFLRLVWMILIMMRHHLQQGARLREAPEHFLAQLKYGLPLGFSRIVQNILNVDNLFVSSFFNITQFTVYSVGSFENPLVNATRSALIEGANIDLMDNVREKNYEKAAETWRRMTRVLLIIVIPFVVYMMFFAKELILFIFSEKYLLSVPFFRVFNLYVLISCLNPEPLFRATSQTGQSLQIKCAGTALGVVLILAGAKLGSPMGILVARILGVGFINFYGLARGARLIKTHFWRLFLWRDVFWVCLLAALGSMLFRFVFWTISWHPFWVLAASFSLYVVFLFILGVKSQLIRPEEAQKVYRVIGKVLSPIWIEGPSASCPKAPHSRS